MNPLLSGLAFAVAFFVGSFLALLILTRPRHPGGGRAGIAALIVVDGLTSIGHLVLLGRPMETAAFALGLGAACLLPVGPLRECAIPGRMSFLSLAAALATFLVYIGGAILASSLSFGGFVLSLLLFAMELSAAALSLYHAYEVLQVTSRTRPADPEEAAHDDAYWPMVSVHVPAHAEPPEMVLATLEALTRLDYPRYEIILIDDNTAESELWQPLVDFCRTRGIKVFHLEDYPGFKSGALNFALSQTAQEAEIVGVVDSDYQVLPTFLHDLVHWFRDPQVAFVQTPQAFRNVGLNSFRRRAALAQQFFFEVGMPSRNDHNSIIFCGTMGLIRKKALTHIGGWDEWCLTEDAEASLRLLRRGLKGVYVNQVYGRGLLPETMEDAKKQRFRWAFGGAQLLKRYWRELVFSPPADAPWRLSPMQRVGYLMVALSWFNDVLVLGFTGFLAATAISYPLHFAVPVRDVVGWALLLPVIAIITGVTRVAWVLKLTTGCSWREGLEAFSFMLALSFTAAQGFVAALFHQRGVFLRTPKLAQLPSYLQALQSTLWETALGILLVALIFPLLATSVTGQTLLLAALLVWHGGVYLMALRNALAASPITEGRAHYA